MVGRVLVAVSLVLFACSGGTTGGTDPIGELDGGGREGPAEVREQEDGGHELSAPEDLVEVASMPHPTPGFAERTHDNCLPDGPYLVDRAEQFRTPDVLSDLDANAVLAVGDQVWVGTPSGLLVRDTEMTSFAPVPLPVEGCRVESLAADGEDVVVGCATGDCLFVALRLSSPQAVVETPCDGAVSGRSSAFACGGQLIRVHDGTLYAGSELPWAPEADVSGAVCVQGEIWAVGPMGAKRTVGGPLAGQWEPICGPQSCGDLALIAAGDSPFAAGGIRITRMAAGGVEQEWLAKLGGLPYDHFTALALSPDGTRLAVGHEIGVSLLELASGQVEHFHSKRYLPGQLVRDLSFDGQGGLWVATNAGLSRLTKEPVFLQDKAEFLMTRMEQWFFRLNGFLTAGAQFDDPWEDETSFLWDDDNDGQWTEEGVGAMCYAYAVTGDERYYDAARRMVENMMLLIDIPAVSFQEVGMNRGFIARSVVRDDETACFADKVTQQNWHLVHWIDGHDYYWKDDTSSDEWTGHFFGLPLYYDLCAKDDEERGEIAEHVMAAADYLLDNGYLLPDLDGVPTTHGNWSPERLTMALDGLQACMDDGHDLVDCVDSWGGGAFLDSVELLSFMAGAWHVTGEVRFYEALEELAGPARVGESAMFTPNVATWTGRGTANYCDHELADLAFLTLIRYDPDGARRQQWLTSMLAAWQYEKGERNPLKALAMAAFLPASEGLAEGVTSLVEYPDDLRMWRVDNSHRLDVELDVNDRHGDPQFKTVLPYDELPILRWDHNPYGVAGGGNGTSRMNPAFWLLPYWGLRYHNAICPDATN